MVCFSQPRVIDIFFAPAKMRDVSEGPRDILSMLSDMNQDKSYTTVTSRHPPAILHTSRQAREVALKYYSLAFSNTVGRIQLSLPPKIYVNWTIDIICPMKTFQLVDHEGDGLSLGSATKALGTNTDMRRLACSVKEFAFFKKTLPKLRLDEVIVYLAPGLDE